MKPGDDSAAADGRHGSAALPVLLVFLRLGLTSFGGPIAHLGFFRDEFVVRRRWHTERSYADLVALCQFLPGPASSQVGMALGLARAGHAGALAAWAGFTLPSALLMMAFAFGIAGQRSAIAAGALHGLEAAAIAVVAQAAWGMARALCTDGRRIGIMVAAAGAVVLVPAPAMQVGVIAAAAVIGLLPREPVGGGSADPFPVVSSRRAAALWLAAFAAQLFGLPLAAAALPGEAFARAAVLSRRRAGVRRRPCRAALLQAQVVPTGWVTQEQFIAGYGAAQALPGPLFSFAAFLGAAMTAPPNGIAGGVLCLVAVFLPSYLLVAGALPFWESLRRNRRAGAALAGVNAAVVGLCWPRSIERSGWGPSAAAGSSRWR
jgi:chromate transporter